MTSAPRPTVAFIWPEGPGFQNAGQATHQESVRQHFEDAGYDTVVFVPGRKVARVTGPAAGPARVATRGQRTIAGRTVVHPRTAVTVLAWAAFRAAPDRLKRRVDAARTAIRARKGIDFVLGAPLTADDVAWLTGELAALQPVVVAPFTSFCAPPRSALPPSVRADIQFLSDHESARHASLTGAGLRVAPFDYAEEQFVASLRPWSAVSAIQWDETAAIQALLPGHHVFTTPASRPSNPAPAERPGEAPTVLFVGSGSMHNVDGLRWFLADIWPRIRATRPDATLQVAGTVCSRVDLGHPGVTGLGEVEDLDAVITAASVLVVPLRAGSGLKVKVVDALCTGSAVVTTPIGAQGFTRLDPLPFLVRDGAEAFAAGVVELLGDDGQRVALRRLAADAAARFSPARAFGELDAFLRSRGLPAPTAAADGSGGELPHGHVCIAVCTYRRPQLLATLLAALQRLELPDGVTAEVQVFDNDPAGSARATVEGHAAGTGPLTVTYQHIGARDIVRVRNAALDATVDRGDFVALIDDDEVPEPHWLAALLQAQRRHGAGAVVGPVLGDVPASCPSWITEGHYFDVVSGADGDRLHEGITGNALLRADVLRDTGLRFDPRLGLAGGEDQDFFRRLVAQGVDVRYAADATVHETVPAERCTLRYLARRSVRVGNTLALLDVWMQRSTRRRAERVVKTAAWFATGSLGVVGAPLRRTDPRHGLLRVARATGMLLGMAHYRYDLYRR